MERARAGLGRHPDPNISCCQAQRSAFQGGIRQTGRGCKRRGGQRAAEQDLSSCAGLPPGPSCSSAGFRPQKKDPETLSPLHAGRDTASARALDGQLQVCVEAGRARGSGELGLGHKVLHPDQTRSTLEGGLDGLTPLWEPPDWARQSLEPVCGCPATKAAFRSLSASPFSVLVPPILERQILARNCHPRPSTIPGGRTAPCCPSLGHNSAGLFQVTGREASCGHSSFPLGGGLGEAGRSEAGRVRRGWAQGVNLHLLCCSHLLFPSWAAVLGGKVELIHSTPPFISAKAFRVRKACSISCSQHPVSLCRESRTQW